jgi:hypothetical protein
MLSGETRVFLVSTVLTFVLLFAAAIAGVGDGNGVLVVLVFGGIGILAPQLYLARTDSGVPARTRIRIAALLTLLFTFGIYGSTPDAREQGVGILAAALVVGLIVYEARAGYREAIGSGEQEP